MCIGLRIKKDGNIQGILSTHSQFDFNRKHFGEVACEREIERESKRKRERVRA